MSTSGEVQEHCPHAEDECWGEVLEPGALDREAAWWVKIQLQDGRAGWTRDLRFEGVSGCN